ncbi:MAG TPA: YbaB/EbfC family nucleoid-associated protein [Armatimonadota bacterium]|nr:YbaB/EbfC family nucleoid-associated protein [Armatimonadota bacterium]
MAGFGGGGAFNQQALMKSFQKIQNLQEEMEAARVEATSGGGMVTAVVSGAGQLVSVTINPEVVDPEDVEMLEDLIVSAVHEAQEKAAEENKQKMMSITGGLKIPGMF